MAGGGSGASEGVRIEGGANKKVGVALSLMVALFFVFGIITVLNDILIPHFKGIFGLTYVQAMMINLCFFGAYFVMAIPSSMIIEKKGYKNGMIIGLIVVVVGCLLFYPASLTITYGVFLLALFTMASGITLLQVAANAYTSALGDPEKASSRISLAGGVNSFATFVGPIIGATYILDEEKFDLVKEEAMSNGLTGDALDVAVNTVKAAAVQGPYLFLAGLVTLILVVIWKTDLPKIISEQKEEKLSGSALDFMHLKLGAFAIFVYVGAEVVIGSLLIDYLKLAKGFGESEAAFYVSLYWGGSMCGRFIGAGLLQKIKAQIGLRYAAIGAMLFVSVSILTTGDVSMWSLLTVGLFNSIMWPTIFSLSLADLGPYTTKGSGILIMGVVGGALIPIIQGVIADTPSLGLKASFWVAVACYVYIAYFAIKGYKAGKSV